MLEHIPSPSLAQAPPLEPVLTPQRKLVIAGLVLALALGYLMYIAFQGAAMFYLTVDELVGRGEAAYGKTVRVSGKLAPESYQQPAPGSVESRFSLTAGGQALPAVYSGPINDLFFNQHSEIVLEGRYGAEGVFHTTNMIIKCPTKYQEAQTSS